jgi:uncharacterized membrane protein
MSPESPQHNPHDVNAELAFVQQALADADRSERSSRLIVGVLAILTIVTFVWMHLNLFVPQNLGSLLHSLLRIGLVFLLLLFAITMYLRRVMNNNTRTILRALANTRSR